MENNYRSLHSLGRCCREAQLSSVPVLQAMISGQPSIMRRNNQAFNNRPSKWVTFNRSDEYIIFISKVDQTVWHQ